MAASDGDYYTHANVKVLLNIPASNTDSDDKINVFGDEADHYISTQIYHFNDQSSPLTITGSPKEELGNLADSLAAATFNYWQTPAKDKTMEHIVQWEKRIQDFIRAFYARASAAGITANTFSKTASKVKGTEPAA